MQDLYLQLKQFGKVKLNEPLAKHTTFKIGGPADFFITVSDVDTLPALLGFLDGEGIARVVLGGGSNVLCSDDGFRGAVVVIADPRYVISEETVTASAGARIQDVSRATVKAGLTGFEWAIGVPGTIAGALRGNAAYNGVTMEDSLKTVDVYRDGEIMALEVSDCAFAYKESIFKHNTDVILRMRLKLRRGDPAVIEKEALENMTYRKDTQPHGYGSAGCTFKNVVVNEAEKERLRAIITDPRVLDIMEKYGKVPVGRLIDLVGLKGKKSGNAMVSDVHANFILNMGGAAAADVMALIALIKEKVYHTFGVILEEEIQIFL